MCLKLASLTHLLALQINHIGEMMFSPFIHSFRNRTPYTLQQALPRTVGAITGAKGATVGFAMGAAIGLPLNKFLMQGNPSDSDTVKMFVLVNVIMATGTIMGSSIGYGIGSGGSKLFLGIFPKMKEIESRFLLGPGIKPKFYLAFTTLALPMAIRALESCVCGDSTPAEHHSAPQVRA